MRWNPLPPFHHEKVNDHWADLAGIEIIRKEPKREEKLGNSDTKLAKEKPKEEKFVITVGIVEELRQKGDSRPSWGLFMRNIVQLSTKISEMTYICRHKDHYELYILE